MDVRVTIGGGGVVCGDEKSVVVRQRLPCQTVKRVHLHNAAPVFNPRHEEHILNTVLCLSLCVTAVQSTSWLSWEHF